MIELNSSRGVFIVLLAAVVVSSGCIENSSTNLEPDFDLNYKDVSVNRSGYDIYQDSMSRTASISDYSVDSDNRMAMNIPVISVSANMTSDGVFEEESYEVNSTGNMRFDVGGNSNSTEFNTRIASTENGAEVRKKVGGEENKTVRDYGMEDLGVSIEALKRINVENASLLGVSNLSGEQNLLLDVSVNSSDLMKNSEKVFEIHSPIQESTEEGGDISEAGSSVESEAYLWVDRDERTPSKFAYYGSAQNGSLQVRSVTEYAQR